MFHFYDMYLEEGIIFAVFVIAITARMMNQIMLLVSIKELVPIRLSHHVVEKLTLFKTGVEALIRSYQLLDEAKAHESGVLIWEHVLDVCHFYAEVLLFEQTWMRYFVVYVINIIIVNVVDVRYLQPCRERVIKMHDLNVTILIQEIPDASICLRLLHRAKCILFLGEGLWLLLLVFIFVDLILKMIMPFVMIKIVDWITRVFMSKMIFLFRDVLDDAHLLDDFDLASYLLMLQFLLLYLFVTEPEIVVVYLGDHGLS